jgi:hypothetical protein
MGTGGADQVDYGFELTSGFLFQFRLMKENSRCSIWFDLPVSGG